MSLSGDETLCTSAAYMSGDFVRVWDTSVEDDPSALRGHGSYVRAVDVASDGATIASGSWDDTVSLRDARTLQPKALAPGRRTRDSGKLPWDDHEVDWITDTIAIGNHLEARDDALVRRAGFRSLLSLDGSMVAVPTAATPFEVVRAYTLIDGPGNDSGLYRRIVRRLVQLERDHAPVLVHCHAGRSRSVVVVAGFLMQTQGVDGDAALDLVRRRREIALTSGIETLLDR